MFFTFRQNNSFGVHKPPAIYVIVEANDYNDANDRAENKGLDFSGFYDCPCCGNRWSRLWSYDEGNEVPSVYNEPLTNPVIVKSFSDWSTEDIPYAIVYFTDGTEKIYRTK